jgi:serine/threonine protein kinase
MDFGIARAAEGTKLTRTGLFVGTPSYMAPEIWEGQSASSQSDVYALGVMLYEMLLGQAPFDAATPAATMRRHLTETPPRLVVVRLDTPLWLADIAERALAKDPAQRYSDAGALLAALRAHSQVQARVDVETLVAAIPAAARQAARSSVPSTVVRQKTDTALKVVLAVAGVLALALIAMVVAAAMNTRNEPTAPLPVAMQPTSTHATVSTLVKPADKASNTPIPVSLSPSATSAPTPMPTASASATPTKPALTVAQPAPTVPARVTPSSSQSAIEPRTVTQLYPPNDAVLKSSVITFKWSGGALRTGETFLVEVIPNTVDKKGTCLGDYDEGVGLRFSPPLTGHEWTTDINADAPGKLPPCFGQIDWQVHIRDATNLVIYSTHQGYFVWKPF